MNCLRTQGSFNSINKSITILTHFSLLSPMTLSVLLFSNNHTTATLKRGLGFALLSWVINKPVKMIRMRSNWIVAENRLGTDINCLQKWWRTDRGFTPSRLLNHLPPLSLRCRWTSSSSVSAPLLYTSQSSTVKGYLPGPTPPSSHLPWRATHRGTDPAWDARTAWKSGSEASQSFLWSLAGA